MVEVADDLECIIYTCSSGGHVVTDRTTTASVDGSELVGYCERCSQRVVMTGVTGVRVSRLGSLISALVEEELKDPASLILEFAALSVAVAEDEASLERARYLLDAAEGIIGQRFGVTNEVLDS